MYKCVGGAEETGVFGTHRDEKKSINDLNVIDRLLINFR